jgi:hypothetical protein
MAAKVRQINIKEYFISTETEYASYLSKHITSVELVVETNNIVKQQYPVYKAYLSDGSHIICRKNVFKEYCYYYEKDYNLATDYALSGIIHNYYDFMRSEYSKRQCQQK